MDKRNKIEKLVQLGLIFKELVFCLKNNDLPSNSILAIPLLKEGLEAVKLAEQQNSWFSKSSIQNALEAWANSLAAEKVEKWLSVYDLRQHSSRKVGLIVAGNIPLVGLHDVLCVLVSDNQLKLKLSSKDRMLMSWVMKVLSSLSESWANAIELKEQLKEIDALIATGSNNSARYFDYYFSNQQKIIRKNRTSIAVLRENESKENLENLAKDVFTHFGMGCRNVTKVYLPKGFDLNRLFEAFYPFKEILQHNKYANNYDYNKAVYLMNKVHLMENGFLLLKEDEGIHSPLAVLFYEYYDEFNSLIKKLRQFEDQIQCKVGNFDRDGFIPFGKAQAPELWDYADGVDTMKFLCQLFP